MGDQPEKIRERIYTRRIAFDIVLISGGVAAFLFLLYQLSSFFSPITLTLALWLLIWPLRRYRAARALLITSALLLTIWLFDTLQAILLPFLSVYLLAYLFNPLVTELQDRFNLPRWVSALGVTLLVIGIILLIIFLIIPTLVNQLEVLATDLIRSMADFRGWISQSEILAYLESVQVVDRQALESELATFLPRQIAALARQIPQALQQLYSSIGSVIGVITMIAIMPVVLFYLLRDYPLIQERLIEFFPAIKRKRDILATVGRVMGNYLRGQLTISAISAVNVSFWLSLFDVPFALLIGLLAGILNMIPNLGIVITNVIGILLALLFGDPPLVKALIVLVVLAGEQLLEATILTPHIMSYRVGLHPVLVILSLFVFGQFMGVLGLLLAVPITALLITFYQTYRGELSLDYAEGELDRRNLRESE